MSNMIEIRTYVDKLYALWLRELKVFFREKSRLVASTFTPLLWLFVIGTGFGSSTSATSYHDIDYQKFIFPGIICMSVIFSSVFFGAYVIWDRKFDFLKSVMVAPVSRATIFTGKTFGGMTNSLIQATILLVVGIIIGVQFSPLSMVETILVILLLSFALTSLGLAIGSYMTSLEGFQMIVSFVVFPLFFLSGALFPVDRLPQWLGILTAIDPATYSVDALRNIILGIGNKPLGTDMLILVTYTAALGALGVLSFRRMKAV